MDISDLLSSLNENDIDQLKKTAASLLGGIGGGDGPTKEAEHHKPDSTPEFDAGLIKTLTSVSSMMNKDDVRSDFLMALKPLLSEEHRERADQAAKMLRLMNILPILKENGALNGILKGLF